jgi:hypothetical protein
MAPLLSEAGGSQLQTRTIDPNGCRNLVTAQTGSCGLARGIREKPHAGTPIDVEPRQEGFECRCHSEAG